MADQTAAQVKAAQQAEVDANVEAEQPKPVRQEPKPEYVGGVPKVRWDNPSNDPTQRKSIAEDPTGVENRKLLADNE